MINFSAELYSLITRFAQSTPEWVHSFAEFGTDAGLLVFAALFAWNGWRTKGTAEFRLALLAPLAVIGAYLVSEVAKSLIQEDRPCRAVAGAVPIAECPSVGDWSFPSNHATIAASCAIVLTVVLPRLAPVVIPLALLMASSRVFVGVHYPHDVAAGFLVGSTVGVALALLAVRLTRPPVAAPERALARSSR
jgi:membrane-associated phospholipid phosphatase